METPDTDHYLGTLSLGSAACPVWRQGPPLPACPSSLPLAIRLLGGSQGSLLGTEEGDPGPASRDRGRPGRAGAGPAEDSPALCPQSSAQPAGRCGWPSASSRSVGSWASSTSSSVPWTSSALPSSCWAVSDWWGGPGGPRSQTRTASVHLSPGRRQSGRGRLQGQRGAVQPRGWTGHRGAGHCSYAELQHIVLHRGQHGGLES